MKKILMIFLLIIFIVFGFLAYNYIFKSKIKEIKMSEMYISSENLVEKIINKETNEEYEITRGKAVKVYDEVVKLEDNPKEYKKILFNNIEYFIDPDYLTENKENIIKEKKKYIRTPSTIYKNEKEVDIQSFVKKGAEVEVIGYDYLNEDGSVNMYKIKSNDVEGYVYSKYLESTQEEANEVYNEDGIHDIHKDRKYSFELFGGSPANLDYYPYEKPDFKDNKLKSETKTYYLNGSGATLSNVDKYIEIAKKFGANAFVIDIKDGALAYKSEVSKYYSQKSYNTAMNSVESYKKVIDKLNEAGFYTIGRIVLFNDAIFAEDNPSECIKMPNGNSTSWVSAYSRKAWEYNVKLALEAIDLFNFNEIQYDYVRFPEASFNWSKNNYDFSNNYSEEKAEAIQNFLFYATDQIHKKETYISIDVFGECSSEYVTAYGQYWPAISNIVDVVSSMPYTDHFDRNNSTYWTQPYQTMLKWGKGAAERQKEIKTPAGVRTWITAYDTPYWNVTTIYGPNEIEAQVKGLVDAGLGHGFITWNARSSISKYETIGPAFSKEY